MGCAGDGTSSIPEARIPERCRFRRLHELPRFAASSCATPSIQFSGRPSFCTVRLCRRWSPRVAPVLSSFGGADWPFHRFPRFRSFGIADDPFRESPRVANLPATSGVWSGHPEPHTLRFCLAVADSGCPSSASACRTSGLIRGSPRFTCCWPRLRTLFQVSLKLLSFGVASVPIGKLPCLSSPRLRQCFAGAFLRFGIDGRVDDESLAGPELCILGLRRG